jgi:Putative Flp pilus-assembly TadE/G-like
MGARPRTGRWGDEGIRVSRERGSILVLFALLLPLLIVCCAIAIDVGYWWVMAKRTQTAADACALAAAQELPHAYADVPNCIVEAGQSDYVLVNIPDQSASDPEPLHLGTRLRSPYSGDPNLVEATVRMRVGTFFGRYVGLGFVEVERRAVAERAPPQGHLAIYAHDDDCSSDLKFNGHNINVDGGIHSNGFLGVDGLDFAGGPTTYVTCNPDVEPGSTFDSGPTSVAARDWPEWFTTAELPCTYTHTSFTYSTPNSTMPAGIYCANDFKIDADGVSGNITVVARTITVNGNTSTLTPYAGNEVLFFIPPNSTPGSADDGPGSYSCDHTNKIELNGNGYDWEGIVFNPCGLISFNNRDITAGASNLLGQVIGLEVSINSSDFSMIGTGEPIGDMILALEE